MKRSRAATAVMLVAGFVAGLVPGVVPVLAALPARQADAAQADAGSLPAGTRLSDWELGVWNDARFRRQFIESYKAETDIEPTVTAAERKTMERVLELIAADDVDGAAGLVEKNRGRKASAVFDFTLANIHFQQERFPEAVAAYRTAVEKFPKFRRAWRNLGVIHVKQGDFESALPVLTEVIRLGGSDAVTYGLLGFAYSSVENEISAESAYRMAILLDPVTPDWKMGLARSLFKQGRFPDAAALLGAMLEKDPERVDLWLLQANAFLGLGRPLDAAENYELVDRLGGSTVESLTMLGDIYINEQLFDVAVVAYERAIGLAENVDPDRVIRAAKVMTAHGALADARELVAAIEQASGDALGEEDRKELLKLRARMAVADGAGDEEARILEEIVALDPLDGEALILLGRHCGRNGEVEKAIFYFERASGIEAFEADASVRHAQLLVQQGKYREALPLLRRAQQVNPRDNVQAFLEQVERGAGRG